MFGLFQACSLSKSDWKSAFEDWFDPKSGEANSNVDRSESQEQRDSPPSDNVVERLSWDGMPVVVVRNPASGNLSAWSSSSPGKRWRTVDVLDVFDDARKLSYSDWSAVFKSWLKPLRPASKVSETSPMPATRDSPPAKNVVDWLSWDGMPVVVVRDPESGNLAAWSSSSPGKRWRTVDVSDVLSEARRLSNSDWNSRFETWLTKAPESER